MATGELKIPTSREPMQVHCLTPDFIMRRILSALEDNKITEDFIDHISKYSSDTYEKIPVSIPSTLVNTTSIESVPPASMSK